MPNVLAWLVMISTPVVAWVLATRYSPRRATMVLLFGASMFWPNQTSFDLPMSPNLDKDIFPAFCMLLVLAIKARPALARARAHRSYELLFLLAAFGAVGTVLTNTDDLVYGPVTLNGLKINDLVYHLVEIAVRWFPPFFLGHALFRSRAALEDLFRFMTLCGLVYSLFILVEIRLSPQLHNWVYGFHASAFMQSIRMGGYRPTVFMRHGLNVSLFMVMCVLATAALYKIEYRLKIRFFSSGRALVFLIVILILCKSTGAYFYAALGIPLVLYAPIPARRWVALGMAVVVLSYPIARHLDLVPVDDIVEAIRVNIGEERAGSIGFRFYNEAEVLENARERMWFGWGYNARPFEHDPYTGLMMSVVDGWWAIELSAHGIVGFLATFLLMLLPIFQAVRVLPKLRRSSDQQLLGTLTLMCAIYMFDWVPNAPISAELNMLVGALAGVAPGMWREQQVRLRSQRREARLASRA
ncbi:MAG: O-antigen ligase family protein [Myxococcota bacterium]